jgi:hypothetical protein
LWRYITVAHLNAEQRQAVNDVLAGHAACSATGYHTAGMASNRSLFRSTQAIL